MGQLPNNEIPRNRAAENRKAANARKQKCQLCGGVGMNGAKWLVKTNDGKVVRVHKPCGERLVASAPAALDAHLMPSPELKAEWAAKRTERQVRDFWQERCPELLKIKKDLEQRPAS